MKLFYLNCGQMITPPGNILAAFNTELLRLVIPVPAYLIDHPDQGLILIDTGFCFDHLSEEMKAALKEADSKLGEELSGCLQQALPAIALTGHAGLSTAFANDVNADMAYAQQVMGYGNEGDVFLGITRRQRPERRA